MHLCFSTSHVQKKQIAVRNYIKGFVDQEEEIFGSQDERQKFIENRCKQDKMTIKGYKHAREVWHNLIRRAYAALHVLLLESVYHEHG